MPDYVISRRSDSADWQSKSIGMLFREHVTKKLGKIDSMDERVQQHMRKALVDAKLLRLVQT